MDYFMVLDAFPGLRNVNFGFLILIPLIAIVIVIFTVRYIRKEIENAETCSYGEDPTAFSDASAEANRQLLENGGWICPLCGSVLSEKIVMCKCGGRKGDAPNKSSDEGAHS